MALEIFTAMEVAEVEPDEHVVRNYLKALANTGGTSKQAFDFVRCVRDMCADMRMGGASMGAFWLLRWYGHGCQRAHGRACRHAYRHVCGHIGMRRRA